MPYVEWTDPDTGKTHKFVADEQFSQEIDNLRSPYSCRHVDGYRMVWAELGNGSTQLRQQCLTCFDLFGSAAPHRTAPAGTSAANFTERDQQRHAYEFARNAIYRSAYVRNLAWWRRYNEYLDSYVWRAKRALVVQRSKGVCEGCGEAPATMVHHLTYAHVFNELLFELVALCERCHARCHPEKVHVNEEACSHDNIVS
jgi:hypothetical protein